MLRRWPARAGADDPSAHGRADEDLKAVRSFLIGECEQDLVSPSMIRGRTSAPVIALSEQHSLESTLRWFESGVDDVIRKPVHIREILARISAIRTGTSCADFTVRRSDGGDRLRDQIAPRAAAGRQACVGGNLDRHGVHFLTAYVAGV